MTKLVLASSSTPRNMLLKRFMIPFECLSPDIDETPHQNELPADLVLRLAKQKADAVASYFPNALVIGADQIGVLDGSILCKPVTYQNAIKQLQFMSGKHVQFLIGMSVLNTKDMTFQITLETFDVIFRKLSLVMIENYLQKEDALSCAGSFKVEGLGITLVEKMVGDDYTALIGLPLIKLRSMLENAGIVVI